MILPIRKLALTLQKGQPIEKTAAITDPVQSEQICAYTPCLSRATYSPLLRAMSCSPLSLRAGTVHKALFQLQLILVPLSLMVHNHILIARIGNIKTNLQRHLSRFETLTSVSCSFILRCRQLSSFKPETYSLAGSDGGSHPALCRNLPRRQGLERQGG